MMLYPIEEYKYQLYDSKVILVDFDNTICVDEWPFIGEFVPGAIETIKKLQAFGHKIVLHTQRDTVFPIVCEELVKFKDIYGETIDGCVDTLTPAVEKCKEAGIEFWGVNRNSVWEDTTYDWSRKVFCDYIIDDHCVGIPLLNVENSSGEECKIVDWNEVDKWLSNNNLYYKGFSLHGLNFKRSRNEYGYDELVVVNQKSRTCIASIGWTLDLNMLYDVYLKQKSKKEIYSWLKENSDFMI